MSVPEDYISKLLEEGQEIPEDPVEIERLLNQQEGISDDDEPEETAEAEETDESDAKDAKEAKGDKPDDSDAKADDADEPSGPPQALLRTLRQSLHERDETLKDRDEALEEANQKIEQLQGRLAMAIDKADDEQQELQGKVDEATDTGVKLEELTSERIAEIREEAGDEVADALEGYAKAFTVLGGKIDKLEQANEALQKERQDVEVNALQNDIDAVPLLAVLQAQTGDKGDGDKRWDRAVQYEKAIRSDPDWQDKSRREIYAEVSRRMERVLGDDTVEKLVGTAPKKSGKEPDKPSRDTAVDEALRRADESATPTSLSDLPAGEAAAQSENARAAGMSMFDVEEALSKAIEKGGPEEADALLARMMTVEDT